MDIKTKEPSTDLERDLIRDPYYHIKFDYSFEFFNGYDRKNFKGYVIRSVLSRLDRLGSYSLGVYDQSGGCWGIWNFDAGEVDKKTIEFTHNHEALEAIIPNFFRQEHGDDLVNLDFVLDPGITYVGFSYFIVEGKVNLSSSASLVVGKTILKVEGHALLKK